jgi:hypothetical protein
MRVWTYGDMAGGRCGSCQWPCCPQVIRSTPLGEGSPLLTARRRSQEAAGSPAGVLQRGAGLPGVLRLVAVLVVPGRRRLGLAAGDGERVQRVRQAVAVQRAVLVLHGGPHQLLRQPQRLRSLSVTCTEGSCESECHHHVYSAVLTSWLAAIT